MDPEKCNDDYDQMPYCDPINHIVDSTKFHVSPEYEDPPVIFEQNLFLCAQAWTVRNVSGDVFPYMCFLCAVTGV